MSRIAKSFIIIPNNVILYLKKKKILVNGNKGNLILNLNKFIYYKCINNKLFFHPYKSNSYNWAIAGTFRSLLNNIIIGVTKGFEKKLLLVGVGYRVVLNNNSLNLFLGYSHFINYSLPYGIIAECLNQNEILIKGCDKQMVGQVAADLLIYRKLEPYKGKGIRYADKIVSLKEIKKK
ncbi:MAG: 50S ribosomal protein L6 [gamma proteobacterium endosymbiont of Trioza apicalis]